MLTEKTPTATGIELSGLADEAFWAPRRCLREPISDISVAAQLLNSAADAYLAGDHLTAERLLRAANMPTIRAWTESIWGSRKANPGQQQYHRIRKIPAAPAFIPKSLRLTRRMPSLEDRELIIKRYGRNCVFCGIPLIGERVRRMFNRAYPEAAPWGYTNRSQHAAFQCMWMQFDHILPHSRGGDNSTDNVVVTCAPCNYGRGERTLEEVGLIDPRRAPLHKTSWDGLERVLIGVRPNPSIKSPTD